MKRNPIIESCPPPYPFVEQKPKKTEFIGYTRCDWNEFIRWLKISKRYNKKQSWNKYLQMSSILLEPSKYIDGRSKRSTNQVKVKITIEEIT